MTDENNILPIEIKNIDGKAFVSLTEVCNYLFAIKKYFVDQSVTTISEKGLDGLHKANDLYSYALAYHNIYKHFAEVETEFELQKMIEEETNPEA
jgi:hypothetical protein